MNKLLRNFLAFTAILLIPAFAQKVSASHFMGGEITYQNVAPGVYVVQTKIYRDCTGATAPTSINLNLKPQGCPGGRSISVQRTGMPTIGRPYCPNVPVTCSSSGMPNFEEVRFSTTVTFSATEQACPNWLFSLSDCCRPNIANLTNPQGNMYYEAYVNLASGINNNSAEFSPLNVPIPFFCVGNETSYSINAVDADGDSLVYSLKAPLNDASTPYQYGTYGVTTIYNSDSTKSALTPAGTFSAVYPFPSFKVDWSQPMPLTPVKSFIIDPVNGILKFTPTFYSATSTPVQGLNKFAMVVQIDEYRKINGIMTKVGHIRRDMLANMIYCGKNINPKISASIANGAQLTDTSIIYLKPNIPLTLQLNTADPNITDVLNLVTDAQIILPGSVVNYSTGNRPTGTITWTPAASDVRQNLYYFSVLVKDNACPVIGSNIRTYAVRVRNTGGVTGVAKDKAENAGFIAYPNPFTREVSFKLNQKNAAQTIIIYNTLGQKIDQISLTGLQTTNLSIPWTNASKFAAGSYVAKLISTDKSSQTIQFSKLQ